ncbi:hypothetical protein N9B24_01450 [bacterium]|nr:hypothetical protein [bacterium]
MCKVNFASSIEDVLNIALLDVKFSLPEPVVEFGDGDSGTSSQKNVTFIDKTADDLIAGGETTRCEFKSTLRGDVRFVVETLDGLSGENVGGWG